ncbi:unnamed protein product [Rotaria magnacalcarata]|uniref:Phosphatidylinositol-glycan biosynthesis class W protein n=2 Tax=Rotaria magnacalcarata TaxID=392030 RepID=A0A816RML0_9BILA|nr:unnamed protein product [Rotaria magnacalcarata]
MMDDYRQRKERFVSNLNGTTLFETGSVMITICSTYFLCQTLKSFISWPNIEKLSWMNYVIENVTLVIPMICVCTFLSSFSTWFHVILWLISILIYFLTKPTSSVSLVSSTSYSRNISWSNTDCNMYMYTCRMDLGVGLFAISHGMVSSEARNKQINVKELFLENIILFILGFIRLIVVKYFSYVEHVSEYGIHWNFFLTLCFMKLIGHCLLKITKNLISLIVVVMIFHEFILLKYFHVDNYLMSSNNVRKNFIDANREGIFSLGGYVCLYLIGVFIGRIIIHDESKQKFKQMGLQLFLGMVFLCVINWNSSRKLCNLSYVSSTAGLACMSLACFSITQ